jgi:bifunctional DNase/RNase
VRLVDVVGLDLEVISYAPVVLLREHDAPHRVLPIFVGGHEALAIVLGLRGEPPHRPLTHDLLAALIGCLDARVDHVEVTELREGTLLARLVARGWPVRAPSAVAEPARSVPARRAPGAPAIS